MIVSAIVVAVAKCSVAVASGRPFDATEVK